MQELQEGQEISSPTFKDQDLEKKKELQTPEQKKESSSSDRQQLNRFIQHSHSPSVSSSSSSSNSNPERELNNIQSNSSHPSSIWLTNGIRTAPVQVISQAPAPGPNANDNDIQEVIEDQVFRSDEEEEEDDLWEDETSSEGDEEEEEEQPMMGGNGVGDAAHLADSEARADRDWLRRPSSSKDPNSASYKEALKQYKRSRRALLLSENGMNSELQEEEVNYSPSQNGIKQKTSAHSLGKGIGKENERERLSRGKGTTMEVGKEKSRDISFRNNRGVDDFTVESPSLEHYGESSTLAIDAADPIGRAHEIKFEEPELQHQQPSRPTSHIHSHSISTPTTNSHTNFQARSIPKEVQSRSQSDSHSTLSPTSRSHLDSSNSLSEGLKGLDFSNLPKRRASNTSINSTASTPKLAYASVSGTPEEEESNNFEEPTLVPPLFASRRLSDHSSNSHHESKPVLSRKVSYALLSPSPNSNSITSPKSSPSSTRRPTHSRAVSKTQSNHLSSDGRSTSYLSQSSGSKGGAYSMNNDTLGALARMSGISSSASNVDSNDAGNQEKVDGPQRPRQSSREKSTPNRSDSDPVTAERGTASGAVHSLWDYLREEILATDFDSTQELKWERVTNFMAIPFWMEKIMIFGFAVCLDSFLYTFTILPLRFAVALWCWVRNSFRWIVAGEKVHLHSSHKCDMLKTLLIVFSCWILSQVTDTSKMYHSVRGQDVVKLYVIFNVLEIADRLCCSFGQDLLDSLFSRITLARRKDGSQPYLRPLGFFLLSLAYILAHTLVLLYQLVTLNVAINSYDNALLTLLLSNQFVEIKGSVFKKFEKENLFQLTCADIVERFQLTLMLSAIGLRNLIEVSGSNSDGTSSGPLPTSFTVFPSLTLLETILSPVLIVLASECIVDWLKHAFITKFNHIRPAVYGRFMDVLCRDLVVAGPGRKEQARKHTFVDQSPIVSRRLGFAALPLACLLVRVSSQIFNMLGDTSHFDECAMPGAHELRGGLGFARKTARGFGAEENGLFVWILELSLRGAAWALTILIGWVSLVAIKLLLGTNLVSYASHRYSTMQKREEEEVLNARDRPPIGVDKEELAYDSKVRELVDQKDDDATRMSLQGHALAQPPTRRPGGGGGGVGSLTDVSRYQMIKSRIW